MNRFFEGVEGVLVFDAVTGGVSVRTLSRASEELRVVKEGGSTWGTSLWKSSERSRCVNVLFACSSDVCVSFHFTCVFCAGDCRYFSENVARLEVCVLAVWLLNLEAS